jgi:hypothetical protein
LTQKRNVKITAMQKLASLLIIVTLALAYSCKEDESDRFKFLTGTVWTPVSLLANGVDATGPGGLLEGFVGDGKFNEDGTGTFGTYTGEWMFAAAEEKLVITTTSLPISVTLTITELTATSLKLQGSFPDPQNLTGPAINIEMTFRAK